MRGGLFIAVCLAFLALGAAAQAQTDTVAEHYRAYEAALARGDRAAAEASAAAALAASEARDREGGTTASLAANLAQVRLDLNRPADALAPAQRALQIAERSGGGVNPTYARLLVGRAELASRGDAGQTRILAALTEAESRRDSNPEAYEAALALGDWALRNDRAAVAQDAYARALRFTNSETEVDNALRARAYLGQGVAMTAREQVTQRNRTGTRLAAAPDAGPAEAFSEALRLSKPIAEREARTGRVTRAQLTYGAALAWSNARGARLNAMDWRDRTDRALRGSMVVDLDTNDGLAACPASVEATPLPAYPADDLRGNPHAAVVRIATDGTGAISDSRVVGMVGDQEFVTAVNAVVRQWPLGAAPSGCSRARVMFVPVLLMAKSEVHGEDAELVIATPGPGMQLAPLSGRPEGNGTWVSTEPSDLIAVVLN